MSFDFHKTIITIIIYCVFGQSYAYLRTVKVQLLNKRGELYVDWVKQSTPKKFKKWILNQLLIN